MSTNDSRLQTDDSVVSRFLYWCAGTDWRLVGDRPVERARYLGIGLAVLLTALIGVAGFVLVLTMSSGGFSWFYLAPAALWGLFVFNVDRLLVSTLDYGEITETNVGEPPKVSRTSKVMIYGARLVVALLVALAITEPAQLFFFRPEVAREVQAIHTEEKTGAGDRVAARADFTKERKDSDDAVGRAEDADRKATDLVTSTRTEYDNEVNGEGGTRVPGCDPRPNSACLTKKAAWDKARADQEGTAKVVAASRQQRDQTYLGVGDRIRRATDEENAAIDADNGLLTNGKALDRVVSADLGVWLRRWVFTLLFFMIDLMPVLLKMFGPRTLTETATRRNAVSGELRDRARARLDRAREAQEAAAEMAEVTARAEAAGEIARQRARQEKERALEAARLEHEFHMRRLAKEWAEKPDEPAPEPKPGPTPGPTPGPGPSSPSEGTRLVLNGRWVVHDQAPPGGESGGMGETRLAHDVDDPKYQVVVKRVRPALGRDTEQNRRMTERFEKELSRHSAVLSPHVAPIVDTGNDPEFGIFIVTDLYPDTLARRVSPPRGAIDVTTPLEWGLRVGTQVLDGLCDCLQADIVHLDIKPANVALAARDEAKVFDFGLAKVISSTSGAVSTGAGGFTIFYAPLEQILRQPSGLWCSSSCDVRAVAATLYEVLTGFPPLYREAVASGIVDEDGRFDWKRMKEFVDMLGSRHPVAPGDLLPGLPPVVNDLLVRWLDPEGISRPQDVEIAAAELREVRLALEGTDEEFMAVGRDHVVDGHRGNGAPRAGRTRPTARPGNAREEI